MGLERLRFITPDEARAIAKEFGTPVFVYSQNEIEKRAREAINFPNAFGITARFAMKACPNVNILKILKKSGIHVDASSEHEAERALLAGFLPEEILLTAQEPAKNLATLVERKIQFNACSLFQLESYGKLFPGREISLRINPGLGSGGTKKTDVGGTTSSFGIWHEYVNDAYNIIKKYNLKVKRAHTHIGSGSDPEVWKAVSHYTLQYAEKFSEVTIVNLGGGYKVGRMSDEKSTDFQKIGEPVKLEFEKFAEKHGRKLHLEIEPGTYMIANCGIILTQVVDKVDTGKNGFEFLKLDTGMDANTRPSLYGSRHPLITVKSNPEAKSGIIKNYVVVGHCCESGDVFTQEMGGEPVTREMEEAEIGDLIVMEGCGAYCSGMSTKNYNSFPETPEVLIDKNGHAKLIRKKQKLEQILENEVIVI